LIISAETGSIDQDLLIQFVMKLMDVDVYAAVPLLLRIDFNRLTPEQVTSVFNTPEVHEQNMGYFVAASFSANRNKASRDLARFLQEPGFEIGPFLNGGKDPELLKLAREQYTEELSGLQQILEDQKRQMREIGKLREAIKKDRARANSAFVKQLNELKKSLDQRSGVVWERQKALEALRAKIKLEIDLQVDQFRKDLDKKLHQSAAASVDLREGLADRVLGPTEVFRRNLQRMKHNVKTIKTAVKETVRETQELKSGFAAKIVRDYMRGDVFLRKIDRRFRLFDLEPRIWKLGSAEVRNSEQFLIDLEEKLEKVCPLRAK
jgi:hypothetical protein